MTMETELDRRKARYRWDYAQAQRTGSADTSNERMDAVLRSFVEDSLAIEARHGKFRKKR